MDHSAINAQVAGCVEYAGKQHIWQGHNVPMLPGGVMAADAPVMFDQDQPGMVDLSAPASHPAFADGFPRSGQSITDPAGKRLIVVNSYCPAGHPAVIITVKTEGK